MIEGARRSTFTPVMGPAVAQLPAASQTLFEPVEAEAVSVPAATAVVSENCAWLGSARPDTPSVAVQARVTSAELQAAGAAAQLIAGALRSTLMPVIGPAVVQFPAASQTLTA